MKQPMWWTHQRIGSIRNDQNTFYQEFRKSGLTLAEFVRTIKHNEYLLARIAERTAVTM